MLNFTSVINYGSKMNQSEKTLLFGISIAILIIPTIFTSYSEGFEGHHTNILNTQEKLRTVTHKLLEARKNTSRTNSKHGFSLYKYAKAQIQDSKTSFHFQKKPQSELGKLAYDKYPVHKKCFIKQYIN